MTSQSDNDGSLGDLSMENYTIDLAQLARRESGKIGRVHPEKSADGEDDEVYLPGALTHDYKDNDDEDESGDREAEGEGDFMGGYEVDLGGFGDKPSSVFVEDRREEREEVPSEADGPEDFTVNMGKWMRGTGRVIKERDDVEEAGEKQLPAPREAQREETREKPPGFGNVEESIMEPLGTSTPAPPKLHYAVEDAEARDAQRPLFARGDTELLQDRAAEEVFQRISALQAEVEKMRKEDESRRWGYERLEDQNRMLVKDKANGRGLKDENRRLKRENVDMQVQIQERQPLFAATASGVRSSSPNDPQAAAEELAAVKAEAEAERLAAKEKIQNLEVSLRASHGALRKLREEMAEDEDMHKNQMRGLREDLERLRAELDSKRAEAAELEQHAEKRTAEVRKRDQAIAKLTDEAKVTRIELEHTNEQLRETRRVVESVEEENDRLSNQNARQIEDLMTMDDVLKGKTTELQAAHASIAKLRESPKEISPNDAEAAKASVHEETHKDVLEALKDRHENAITSLKAKYARQLQILKTEHDSQTSKHRAELERTKQARDPNTAMETELRTAIRALSSKLEKANAATRAARVEAEKAQQTAETIKQDNDTVNAALEGQFAETVEAREREWRRRVAVLFRERDTMGKALMVGWGKEDVGAGVKAEDGGQGYRYRYRFVKR